MRELVIERDSVDYAEKAGWLVRKCVYAGRRGSPDRWFFKKGHLVLIEFKKPGEKPDAVQQREHDRLRGAGFKVYVVTSLAQATEIFEAREREMLLERGRM